LANGDIARLLWISSVMSCHVMAAILGLIDGNSAIQSADPENPNL